MMIDTAIAIALMSALLITGLWGFQVWNRRRLKRGE